MHKAKQKGKGRSEVKKMEEERKNKGFQQINTKAKAISMSILKKSIYKVMKYNLCENNRMLFTDAR